MAVVISPSVAFPSRVVSVLYSYVSTLLFIGLGLLFYTRLSPFHVNAFNAVWRPVFGSWISPVRLSLRDVLQFVALAYMVLLLPYYVVRSGRLSKASVALTYLSHCLRARRWFRLADDEKQAFLSLLLKFLFIPFCLNGVLSHFAVLNNQFIAIGNAFQPNSAVDLFDFFNSNLHVFILNVIFIVDFAPFLIGYMIESKWLRNEIVTVESSVLGWFVCLLCYPPFNGVVGSFLAWRTADHVVSSPWIGSGVQLALNCLLIVLFGVYAWASVAIGFKCSNLTNRGVVDSGPYRWIRHPAYALKNCAWWVAGIPVFLDLFHRSWVAGVWGVCSMAGWSCIYCLRAWTEELHMLRVDTGYRGYMQRVKYRFVPGLI